MFDAGVLMRAAAVTVPVDPYVHILVTLRRFDDKVGLRSNSGPFIPCERRLAIMEYLEIQGRAFLSSF